MLKSLRGDKAVIEAQNNVDEASSGKFSDSALDERETTAGLLEQLDNLQSITVTQQIADSSIQKRITNILNTSEWFKDLSVSATEGIVILRAQTSSRDHREWAEAIASRTEGVVAVINKIHVVVNANDTLSPLIDESRAFINKFINALPLILLCIFVIAVVLLLARYVSALSYRLVSKRVNSIMLGRLVARLCAIPVLLVGIFLVLNITGLSSVAATVIGGTGLLGLVIGFAFRDIAENFLASILISLQRYLCNRYTLMKTPTVHRQKQTSQLTYPCWNSKLKHLYWAMTQEIY